MYLVKVVCDICLSLFHGQCLLLQCNKIPRGVEQTLLLNYIDNSSALNYRCHTRLLSSVHFTTPGWLSWQSYLWNLPTISRAYIVLVATRSGTLSSSSIASVSVAPPSQGVSAAGDDGVVVATSENTSDSVDELADIRLRVFGVFLRFTNVAFVADPVADELFLALLLPPFFLWWWDAFFFKAVVFALATMAAEDDDHNTDLTPVLDRKRWLLWWSPDWLGWPAGRGWWGWNDDSDMFGWWRGWWYWWRLLDEAVRARTHGGIFEASCWWTEGRRTDCQWGSGFPGGTGVRWRDTGEPVLLFDCDSLPSLSVAFVSWHSRLKFGRDLVLEKQREFK